MRTLISLFRLMKDKHGDKYLLEALRLHYSDICSDGDLAVHRILDALEANANVIAESKTIQSDVYETLKHWLRAGKCEPDVWHVV